MTTTDVDVRRRRRRRGFKGETFLITTTTDLREGCDCGGPLVGRPRSRGRSVGWKCDDEAELSLKLKLPEPVGLESLKSVHRRSDVY